MLWCRCGAVPFQNVLPPTDPRDVSCPMKQACIARATVAMTSIVSGTRDGSAVQVFPVFHKRFPNSTMAAITDYKLISTEEDGSKGAGPSGTEDWKLYPGDRRSQLKDVAPPKGMMFVRTGGNALQAISRDVIENKQMISVVVPEGKDPGDELLVACPFVKDRLISVIIPKNATAGSVFLVQPPPIAPEVFTGIPVKPSSEDQTPVVVGWDLFAQDELALQEENRVSPTNSLGNHESKPTKDPDEEEYEMVERDGLV